ncbi:hypothetical protein HanIR_Chr17g0848311 [Helianthus annuus]|nr:hypothetical protein HanIR_Chr17g0848311 [Helianthus annuus]
MQGPNCKMQGPKWKMENKSPSSSFFLAPLCPSRRYFFFDYGAGGGGGRGSIPAPCSCSRPITCGLMGQIC